jgi:hypothetical protein
MPDSDVDEQIRTFRQRLDRELAIPEDKTIEDWLNQEFRNPTAETPIEISEFLSFLDVRPFLKVFMPNYQRFKIMESRLGPRLKFALFLVGKGCKTVMDGYRMLNDEKTRRNLGFRKKPTYEILREFVNEKLPKVEIELCKAVVLEVKRELERLGLPAFKHLAEDATDIKARKTDSEAAYSGYYEEHGYKEDIMLDTDNNIPVSWTDIGINECEGYCLPDQLKAVFATGARPETLAVDGKYATYENIAVSHTTFNVRLVYKILDDWVWNSKGEPEEIKRRYQAYREEAGFKTNATVQNMLELLFKVGDYEHVGAYYRNIAMTWYHNDPEGYLSEFHQRSLIEAHNNRFKNEIRAAKNVPKGRKKVAQFASLCHLLVHMIVLNRLRHGIKTNLSSVVYLT